MAYKGATVHVDLKIEIAKREMYSSQQMEAVAVEIAKTLPCAMTTRETYERLIRSVMIGEMKAQVRAHNGVVLKYHVKRSIIDVMSGVKVSGKEKLEESIYHFIRLEGSNDWCRVEGVICKCSGQK